MKTRKALIEKLRLKNSTLKVQKKKLQMALKQKEDMGEVSYWLTGTERTNQNALFRSRDWLSASIS